MSLAPVGLVGLGVRVRAWKWAPVPEEGGEPERGGTLAPGAARGVVAGDEGS